MLHGALARSLTLAGRNTIVLPKRTIVETPPMVRMSFYKKLLLGGTACSSFLFIPSWVFYNMKYYNGSAYKTEGEEE